MIFNKKNNKGIRESEISNKREESSLNDINEKMLFENEVNSFLEKNNHLGRISPDVSFLPKGKPSVIINSFPKQDPLPPKKPVVIIKKKASTIDEEAKPQVKKPVVRIISVEEQLRMKNQGNNQSEVIEKSEPTINFDLPPTLEQINRSSVNISSNSKTKLIDEFMTSRLNFDENSISDNSKNFNRKINQKIDNLLKNESPPIIKEKKYFFESLILDSIDKKIETSSFKSKILKKFNMIVNEYDVVIVYGLANSGKTTLLNILSFKELFNSGEYIINDKYFGELIPEEKQDFIRKNIFLIHKSLSIDYENDIYFYFQQEYDDKNNKFKSRYDLQILIDKFKINSFMSRKFNELIKFEKQVILLAFAVLKGYEIILFDEPFVFDDKNDDKAFKNAINVANNFFKKTLIIATSSKVLFDIATKKYYLTKGTAKLIG